MKYRCCICILLILTVIFTSCKDQNQSYKFRQDLSEIARIEIMYQPLPRNKNELVLELKMEIPTEQHELLCSELQLLDGGKMYPPGSYFGPFIIRITYQDGEIELIGVHNNGGYSSGDTLWRGTFCFRDDEGFYSLIGKYLEIDAASEADAWEKLNLSEM